MKYTVKPTSKFQKDLKRIQKRGYDMRLMTDIIKKLANGEILPPKNRDHNLSGNYSNCQGGRTACSRSIWRGRRISYGWGNNILGSDHDSYLL